jgi:hypothetical protein
VLVRLSAVHVWADPVVFDTSSPTTTGSFGCLAGLLGDWQQLQAEKKR